MMLATTQNILNKAIKLAKEFNLLPADALNEAFSDELGFGSNDLFTMTVVDELHTIGLLLNHKIIR